MSFDTNNTFVYQIVGRDIHLYQYIYSARTDMLAGYRIRIPDSFFGDQLVYPDETITSGLRFEGTTLTKSFVTEPLEDTTGYSTGTDISFSTTTITGAGTNDGLTSLDRIRIQGSTSNDGDYTSIAGGGSNTLVFAASTFTAETAGAKISINQIPLEVASPTEISHVNLSRMLSLAVIDYIKGQLADLSGNVELKEYYMREFWKKVGDDKSNKIKTGISYTSNTYAVK